MSITFEEWIRWNFDRPEAVEPSKALALDVRHAKWEQDTRTRLAHLIRLFEDPVDVLRPYSDNQIGMSLLGMFDSGGRGWFRPSDYRNQREEFARLVHAVGQLVVMLTAARCPNKPDSHEKTRIGSALYMFWDIAPIWPVDGSQDWLLDVCLEEMRAVLVGSNHCVAQCHALHGLGHFQLYHPDRTTPIVDEFLSTRARAHPEVRDYAMLARGGRVI